MVGRNRFFFPSASPPFSLGGGLEAWRGFYSSVRPAFNQLMVNVNVCATAFYSEGNLAEAMNVFERASFGARMSAFVQRLRVRTDHLGHQKTVKRLGRLNAKQHKFEAQELGGMVTVEEYFRRSKLLVAMHLDTVSS
jgi:eukaryotic translation initiation factor 2C